MKSSSGGSNSSSSNNSTTMNTHKSAVGAVSLHAIVGGDKKNNNINNETTKSTKSTATRNSTNGAVTGTKAWQRSSARHLEQATLYGQNSNSSKSRVGVTDCDDCGAAMTAVTAATATAIADADESRSRYHHHHNQHHLQPQQQQSQLTTPTRRRDLESFRHYAGPETATTTDDNAKDDDLRLSTRQLRRQQQPFGQSSSSALLQRSHSISTDDLSNDWETNESVAESNEWRRVSKLRRSFQSSSSANNSSNTSIDQLTQQSPSTTRRQFDLPASTVSVSRIRAELESGRRLTTAMRNNHVDLAALESILHGPRELEKRALDRNKRNTLLTAESLKEIRGRLKKLSDESLYKEDFIAYQQPPAADEHIEVQQSLRRKLSTPRLQQLTPEQSLEISTPSLREQHQSAFKAVGTQRSATESDTAHTKHASHSLESRQKVKDTNSSEWHSRRKSYGFEKMSPPDNKTMHRMDASTDSGLGRSGELGNWSPTETAPATARATVIHFGEPAKTVTQPAYRTVNKSPARRTPDEDLLKRHSIAVDESQYVRDNLRKTSQVHLNGFYDSAESSCKPNMQLARYESNNETACNANSALFQRTQNAQKRVEFCKTEVHFAAESGRVNIVETDGKPPPTNNFRRRRRTASGPLQSLTKSASTAATTVATTAAATATSNITHFGDDHQRHRTIASSVVAYKASLVDAPDVIDTQQQQTHAGKSTAVTVSVQKSFDSHAESSRGSYASTTSGVDTTDNENDEIAAIRGILKNKPVKPKPYHLGENIDNTDALWGVQLKPIAAGAGIVLSGAREKDDSPTASLSKSVAERVRIVEKRHEHTAQNGYSTKINLSLDEPAAPLRDWPNADLPKSNIMSIELHSPQISLGKRDSFKRNQSPPVAKPRTIASTLTSNEHPQVHVATTVKQSAAERFTTSEQQRESLKIVKEARGARKLREHELSYFGVPHAHRHEVNETSKTKMLPNSNSNNIMSTSKRTLPSRQRLTVIGNDGTKPLRRHEINDAATTTTTTPTINELTTKAQTTTKWQLLNDKPDLLRHSPIAVETKLLRRTAEVQSRERTSSAERGKRVTTKELRLEDEHDDEHDDDDDDNSDHYYENISNEIKPIFKVKSPQPYDRKTDVERDAFILSEMNENADLTMKALSDEAAHKDRRRRRSSLHRRDSKPLETIDEKIVSHKPKDACIAVKMSRGTLASEAKRNARHTTPSPGTHQTHTRVRTSSQSSVESCPRARSRSLSSEREYENIRATKSTTRTATSTSTKMQPKTSGKQQHRSSSRESQRSARLQYSSGDEVNARVEQRVRMKNKRSASSTGSTRTQSADRRSKKESTVEQQHHSKTVRDDERRRAASSTTHASQREERAECGTGSLEQQRTTSSGRSSSGKRREEQATSSSSTGHHTSSRSTKEKARSGNAGVRLLRSLRGRTDDAAAAQHRSSGHRSTSEREKVDREREHEKDREKEKQSKSRGHSTTNKIPHHSSSEHQQPRTTHQLSAHSGSMSSKTREHKKSTTTVGQKQHESAATPTHSKSSQIINGRQSIGKHDDHHKHTRHESSTTAHRKRSERK